MSNIPFKCRQCGSTSFKVTSEPKSYEEFVGAACATCGAKITDDDVREQAGAIIDEIVKKLS